MGIIRCSVCKYCENTCDDEPCCHCTENYGGDKQGLFFEPISTDSVNHPNHYAGKIECIDAMLETQGLGAVQNFCICNAFKYLWRHGRKNGIEDVKKAIWYLNKYIELEEDENASKQ